MSVERLKRDFLDAAQKYKTKYKTSGNADDLDSFKRLMDVYFHLDDIGGGGGSQDLQSVTDIGNTTTNDIDVAGVLTDYVQLDTAATPVPVAGMLYWDQDEETAGLQVNGLNYEIGQGLYWVAKNQTGVQINKGTAVYASGTLGASGRILIAPMIADGSIEAKYFLGITAEDIADGDDGKVITQGKVRQIDTAGYGAAGNVLWVSPTTPGALTQTQPTGTDLALAVAFVVHYASNGVLAVRVSVLDENSIGVIPTLDQVTTAGNTTTNAIVQNGVIGTSSFYSIRDYGFNTTSQIIQRSSFHAYTTNGNTGIGIGTDTAYNGTIQGFSGLTASSSKSISLNPFGGNVLIGTTTDAGYKLDVNGTLRATGQIAASNGLYSAGGLITSQSGLNSGRMTMFNLRNTGGGYQSAVGTSLAIAFTNREPGAIWSDDVIENIIHSNTVGAVTTGYNFYTHNNQLYNASPYLAMSINGGNVGIGTSSPTAVLEFGDTTLGYNGYLIKTAGQSGLSQYQFKVDGQGNVTGRVFAIESGANTISKSAGITNIYGYNGVALQTWNGGLVTGLQIAASTGNVLIGTTTDAGYKLDVNGNTIVRGGTLNLVGNYLGITGTCGDVNIFNNCGTGGNVSFSLGGNKYLNIYQPTGSASGITSGNRNTISSSITYSWSSGTVNSSQFVLNPTINNTGTYSGIFRGIYYNPTLTSLTGTTHRGVEIASGDFIWGNGYSQYYGNDIEGFVQFQSSGNNTNIWLRQSGGQQNYNGSYWSRITQEAYKLKIIPGNYQDGYFRNQSTSGGIYLGGSEVFNTYGIYISNGVGLPPNVLIGTTTDAGYKLDVNGSVRAQGGVYVSEGQRIEWAAGREYLMGNGGRSTMTLNQGGNALAYSLSIAASGFSQTSGTGGVLSYSPTINPTSGTAVFNLTNIAPTINQTGGANGITRGLYINPTLTSVYDFRAIETTSGNVVFNGGNVGIGTSSPAVGVDVRNGFNLWVGGSHYLEGIAASGTDASLVLRRTNNNGWVRYALLVNGSVSFGANVSTGEVQLMMPFGGFFQTFYANGSEAMRISTSRNLLIGTTTDAGYKLYVSGSARVTSGLTSTGTNYLGLNYLASNASIQSSGDPNIHKLNNDLIINAGASPQSIYMYTNGAPVVSIKNDGNVGIGTTAPEGPLHVKYSSATVPGITIENDGVGYNAGSITLRSGTTGGVNMSATSNGGFYWFNLNTTSNTLSLPATGNLLVGSAVDAGYRLDVQGGDARFAQNVEAASYSVAGNAGYSGIVNFPSNPPGSQNLEFLQGILINVF